MLLEDAYLVPYMKSVRKELQDFVAWGLYIVCPLCTFIRSAEVMILTACHCF